MFHKQKKRCSELFSDQSKTNAFSSNAGQSRIIRLEDDVTAAILDEARGFHGAHGSVVDDRKSRVSRGSICQKRGGFELARPLLTIKVNFSTSEPCAQEEVGAPGTAADRA